MASWDIHLIAKILNTKDINTPITKYGIAESHLKDPLASEIYTTIVKHRTKYGEFPSIELIRQKFKEYEHFTPEDSIEAICEQIIDNNFHSEFDFQLKKILTTADQDPKQALALMERGARELRNKWKFSSQDIDLSTYAGFIKEQYHNFKVNRGVTGLHYPWSILSEETGGMHKQDLIVLYGAAKSCKSWLILYMASFLFKEFNKRILFVTKEMSPHAIAIRAASIIAKLPYGDFRKGKLTSDQETMLFDTFATLSGSGFFKISDGRAESGGAVSVASLITKIEEYCPDIMFVDGSYLMGDDRTKQRSIDHKNITHITQDLKDLAQTKNIPIVITTQTNRYGDSGSKNEDLAFSNSYIQDCDALFRIFRNKKLNEIAILTKALREGEEKGITINCKIAEDFTLKSGAIQNLNAFIKSDKEGSSALYMEETPDGAASGTKEDMKSRFKTGGSKLHGDPGLPKI